MKSALKLESLTFFHVFSVCEIPLTLSLNEVTKKTNTIDGHGAACMHIVSEGISTIMIAQVRV